MLLNPGTALPGPSRQKAFVATKVRPVRSLRMPSYRHTSRGGADWINNTCWRSFSVDAGNPGRLYGCFLCALHGLSRAHFSSTRGVSDKWLFLRPESKSDVSDVHYRRLDLRNARVVSSGRRRRVAACRWGVRRETHKSSRSRRRAVGRANIRGTVISWQGEGDPRAFVALWGRAGPEGEEGGAAI